MSEIYVPIMCIRVRYLYVNQLPQTSFLIYKSVGTTVNILVTICCCIKYHLKILSPLYLDRNDKANLSMVSLGEGDHVIEVVKTQINIGKS